MTPSVKPASSSKRSGVVVPHRPRRSQQAVSFAVFLMERIVTASLRCQWRDRSGLTERPSQPPVIFCLWHNRLAISMAVHRRYPRKLAALSAHATQTSHVELDALLRERMAQVATTGGLPGGRLAEAFTVLRTE